MEEIHRETLRQNLRYLLKNLKVQEFIDLIYSNRDKILSNEDYEQILAKKTESDKIRHIVLILQRSGPKAYDACICSLRASEQAFIAEELEKKRNELLTEERAVVFVNEFIENQRNQPCVSASLSMSAKPECRWEMLSENAISQSFRKESSDTDLTGYIQHVQKKCQSARGNSYSSFLVQTDEKTYQRCLTFFPDPHKETLERYAKEKIPVCLKDCSYYVPSKKGRYEMDTINIDSNTEFENAEVGYDYIPFPFTCLADINESWRNRFILIKVTIFKEDAPIKIDKDGNELDMQVKHVYDKEGHKMELTAWEQFVSLLKVGKCYELSNVSVNVYNGICKLSTNTGTSANEASFK